MNTSFHPKLASGVRIDPLDITANRDARLITGPNGRQWQVPASLADFVALLDGSRSITELQGILDCGNCGELNRCSAQDILDSFVLPGGLLNEDSTGQAVQAVAPARRFWGAHLLSISLPLFHAARLQPVTRRLQFIFHPCSAALAAALGILFHVAIFRQIVQHWPTAQIPIGKWHVLAYATILLLALPIHELGHIAAIHRFGRTPGMIGMGVYLCFPVMYVDLTSAWTLSRWSRVVVDCAGIYFQFVVACLLALVQLSTANLAYGLLAVVYLATAAVNLLPWFQLDGYWCLSDASGIPNLERSAFKAVRSLARASLGMRQASPEPSLRGWRHAFLVIFGISQVGFYLVFSWTLLRFFVRMFYQFHLPNVNRLKVLLAGTVATPNALAVLGQEIARALLFAGVVIAGIRVIHLAGAAIVRAATNRARGKQIAALLLLGFAAGVSAQTPDQTSIKVTSRLVTVDVSVLDKRTGAKVERLSKDDFEVLDDGRPQDIVLFSGGADPIEPIYLLFLIDVRHTTMADVPYLRDALSPVLRKMRPQDKIGVMDLWRGFEMVQELTTDREAILNAISAARKRQEAEGRKRSQQGQGQDIAACLAAGIRHVRERHPNGRPVFVIFSDDLNATPRRVVTDTSHLLLSNSATVYGLIKVSSAFTAALKPLPGLAANQHRNIEYYSQQTGGKTVDVHDHDYGAALEEVVGDIEGRYSLAFVPSAGHADNRFHKITVKVRQQSSSSGAREPVVRARKGYIIGDQK